MVGRLLSFKMALFSGEKGLVSVFFFRRSEGDIFPISEASYSFLKGTDQGVACDLIGLRQSGGRPQKAVVPTKRLGMSQMR